MKTFGQKILIIGIFVSGVLFNCNIFALDDWFSEEEAIKSIEEEIIEAQKIAEQEAKRLKGLELERKKTIEEARRKEAREFEQNLREPFNRGILYYKDKNYPFAIMEFKKVLELGPDSRFAREARYYLERSKLLIKREEEQGLLARMEEARFAKLKREKAERRRRIEDIKKKIKEESGREEQKRRQQIKQEREKAIKLQEVFKKVEWDLNNRQIGEAINKLETALQEFPQEERLKDFIHKLKVSEIRQKEQILKKEREINEEAMLLEVAKRQVIPEEKFGSLDSKEITPIVKVPEIRKKLKNPVSVDFKEVELSYALGFLQDLTGVNIVPSSEVSLDEKVTIKIKEMPLEEALKYILKSQGLIYRIEEDAV